MFASHSNASASEVVLLASSLINPLPSKTLQFRTPVNTLLDTFPHVRLLNLSNLKFFVALCLFTIIIQTEVNLTPNFLIVCLLVTPLLKKGTMKLLPLYPKIFVSCDVSFLKHQPFYTNATLLGEMTHKESHWDLTISMPISFSFTPVSFIPLAETHPPK